MELTLDNLTELHKRYITSLSSTAKDEVIEECKLFFPEHIFVKHYSFGRFVYWNDTTFNLPVCSPGWWGKALMAYDNLDINSIKDKLGKYSILVDFPAGCTFDDVDYYILKRISAFIPVLEEHDIYYQENISRLETLCALSSAKRRIYALDWMYKY